MALLASIAAGGFFYVKRDASPAKAESQNYLAKLPLLQDDATTHVESVSITAELLNRLMAQDVAAARPYLDYVRSTDSAAAADAAEAGIRGYYLARIKDMAARKVDADVIQVPVATAGGRLTFSTVSYDGSFTVKDPVSVLFFGNARVDSIYDSLVGQQGSGGFLDQDGPSIPGKARTCRSQTQWVLMGEPGESPTWQMDTKGLMWGEGGCASGTRNHVRLFGGLTDSEYGSWVVATPHREDWRNGGHVVVSWQEPMKSLVDTWTSENPGGFSYRSPEGAAPQTWTYCRVNSEGKYQNVPFDGRAAIIAIP